MASMTSQTPEISFVIPVRDDAERLKHCLESIRANDYPADRVEIIVVDHGSHDGSVSVARSAGATTITVGQGRVGHLRNVGSETAKGRILAFVDADHVLAPGWIGAAADDLQDGAAVSAVGAMYRAPPGGTWVQRAYDRLRSKPIGQQSVDWLGAGNLAVLRDAFMKVGGFDTELESCEDVDLSKKLRAQGYRMMSDDRLLNVHSGDPATLTALFRGELWRGRSNLAVSLRPPITMRELPSAVVPVVQLAGLIGALVIPFVATGGLLVGSLALIPIILIPTIRAASMSWRSQQLNTREFGENLAVAFVYDLARALALLAFAGHRVRRR